MGNEEEMAEGKVVKKESMKVFPALRQGHVFFFLNYVSHF